MRVYLQVERGQVAVNGVPHARRTPVPLRDRDVLALSPASGCIILIGVEVTARPDLAVALLDDAKPSKRPPPRLLLGEPVARFQTVRPPHARQEKTLLESYFPENCSLRQWCGRVAGSPASELQTPEGAVLFLTQVGEAGPAKAKQAFLAAVGAAG